MGNKENKKKFKLFDLNRDGKGVEPGEDTTPNLKFFFKQLGRKFSKIISLNMLMDIQIITIIVCIYLYFFGSPVTPSVNYSEFPLIYGIQQISTDAVTAVNLSGFSYQLGLPTYNTYIYWVIGAIVVFHLLTYGLQKVGSVYVLRGLVRGDSVFILSDYFYAIKKNFKQGMLLGIIDSVIIAVLTYDFLYFFNSASTMFNNFMYSAIMAIFILYSIARFYLYLMIVTFNIKIGKAFKNAFIFCALGIKRNIMACIGIVIVTAIAIGMVMLLLPLGLGVTLVLPLIYYLGVCGFIYTYAAYPVIKKYMIDGVNTPDSGNAVSISVSNDETPENE